MPNHFVTAVAGIVVGLMIFGAIAAIRDVFLKRNLRDSVTDILRKHFGKIAEDQIEVHSREFPYRVAVDGYRALTDWVDRNCKTLGVVGLPISETFMSSVGIGSLLATSYEPKYPTALEYDSFDVGNDQQVNCVKHALWLLDNSRGRLAVLWTSTIVHSGCGMETKLRLDVANVKGEAAGDSEQELFRHIEDAIHRATTYRGKILSLESNQSYRGNAGGIVVHKLRSVVRDDVILPETTLRLLERNVIRFVQQRSELTRLGMPAKKGLLFYGPPGTGKTHTIHFLIGALAGHTTLLVTAEQVGMLDEYMALARLLQPTVMVLEDVDLIGRERESISANCESLLNKLLNEMDGLRPDAEVLFLMTTNRPESLERALAARPGRVDQAIEFPLPDETGRRKLIRLYAAGASIADEVIDHTARTTEGVSASFIKELMRRAIQFHLECRQSNGDIRILQNDVDQALDELLFVGGALNRALLGADGSASGSESG